MNPQLRPEAFLDLQILIPDLHIDLKYFTGDNFIGEQIDGYEAPSCLISRPAALALQRLQRELMASGLGLKIYDAYRPQRAVDHFIRWTDSPADPLLQSLYYPGLRPEQLFREGYLIAHSSHSRGSTVDLTLVDLRTGAELDMGSRFDFFGPLSWIDSMEVAPQCRANRLLLRQMMEQHGFVPLHHEWWHFTLADEPFPDTYFDFPLQG